MAAKAQNTHCPLRPVKSRKKPVQESKPDPKKITVHYTAKYIVDPPHPITVNVIGCGGTGSQVLNSLARMHSALIALGHPGFYVRAIDPDKVTEANMGRQLFSPADVGGYKAVALITRINRFFGLDWEVIPELYKAGFKHTANITISCVDSGAARTEIRNDFLIPQDHHWKFHSEPWIVKYYWMDFGNMMDRGQVILGTVRDIKQPEQSEFNCVSQLPTVDILHPDILKDKKGENQGPSCSLAEALGKQDLFINSNLANMGLAILWKMFRQLHITHNGLYLNLETLSVNPIKIA